MARILHCGDLHLETSFARLGLPPALGNMLREELRTTLGSILSEARRLQVDAVTVAGDLFERATAGSDTAHFLLQQFERMRPIKILIAPGERDAYSSHSLYELTHWPANVHIFAAPRFDPLALAADVTVWGAACPASDPQAWRQTACSPGAQHLLLAHAPSPRTTEHTTGQVTAPVFAVSEDTLAAAGFSLALLGGSHQPQLPAGGARIVFPGSPQPLDWDDGAADRGATLVTVDSAGCRVQPVPFRSWRLARVRVDVGGVLTAEEAARCIAEALAPGGASNRATQVAQVTLTGEPAADFTLADVDGALADVLGAEIRVVLRRAFVLPYDLDRLATEPTVRGALVRRVQAQLAAIDASADPAARADLLAALKAALLALEGRQVHLDAIP